MTDLLPDEVHRWNAVENIARKQFGLVGLKEIRTPLLEATELFSRSIGEASDVVGKEMYTFFDRADRSCTLRPEGTASVVRSALQHGLLSQGPQRLWYLGPMFRYERPQAGRQRQFHQLGVEYLGLASSRIDSEVISIAWDLLLSLGLKGLVLEINSLGKAEDRRNYRTCLIEWLQDNFEHLDSDSQKKININPLRILDTKNVDTQKMLKEAPLLINNLCNESLDRFEKVQELLKALEIPFKLNPRLVRGLDYYGHTAFEILSDQLGAQSTVCGGGRYDSLIEELGGADTPAMGFAIGLERLLLILGNSISNDISPDVYFVNKGYQAETNALVLSRKLRAQNISIELDSSGSAFAKQFKRADRSGAKWALVLGDDEVSRGEVFIKRLRNSHDDKSPKQYKISSSDIDQLINFLKDKIKN